MLMRVLVVSFYLLPSNYLVLGVESKTIKELRMERVMEGR